MIDPPSSRIALVLPISTSSAVVAATRVVIFLLRTAWKVELAVLPRERDPRLQVNWQGVLLVSTEVRVDSDDSVARERMERLVRAQVERLYAQHGIADVEYDLQVL